MSALDNTHCLFISNSSIFVVRWSFSILVKQICHGTSAVKTTLCLPSDHRLKNIFIGLTNHDPKKDGGPHNNPFHLCASRTGMDLDEQTISLTCVGQPNTRGRYLFIAPNNTRIWFGVAEVEVFNGRCWIRVSFNVANGTANKLVVMVDNSRDVIL